MDTVTVTISGESIELTPPTSPSQIFDFVSVISVFYSIDSIAPSESARTMCACLGVCWPRQGAKALKTPYHPDPMVYGGRVFDELVSRKASVFDIVDAAREAVGLVSQAQNRLFAAAVASKDRADFSDGE